MPYSTEPNAREILEKKENLFLISNFRPILNVVCFLLGNSPASEFYMRRFGTHCLFHLYRWIGMKDSSYLSAYEDGTECSETSACKIQTPGNYPEESIQQKDVIYQDYYFNLVTT